MEESAIHVKDMSLRMSDCVTIQPWGPANWENLSEPLLDRFVRSHLIEGTQWMPHFSSE